MGNTPSQQQPGGSGSGPASGDASRPQRLQPSSRPAALSPPALSASGSASISSGAGAGPRSSPSTSSLRPGSPRRRKSLELPDLNTRLSLTTTTGSGPGSASDSPARSVASPPPSAMPIPGAKGVGAGVRRWGSSRDRSGKTRVAAPPSSGQGQGSGTTSAPPEKTQHNPYFPAVPEAPRGGSTSGLNPVTPGLPDYSHSPGSGGAGIGASVQHTEDINAAAAQNMSPEKASMLAEMYDLPAEKREQVFRDTPQVRPWYEKEVAKILDAKAGGPSGSGSGGDRLGVAQSTGPPLRQPSPARPAPAIVTHAPQHHDHQSSPLEKPSTGTTPVQSAQPSPVPGQSVLNPARTPLPTVSPTPQARADQEVINSHLPEGNTPQRSPEEGEASASTLAAPSAPNSIPASQVQTPASQGVPGKEEPAQAPEDELVPTLVTWNGGGKDVYVTGTFAEHGWKTRLRLEKSTHDFSLLLNLPPGTHRVKFIVDGHWRCSQDLQTATDGDGNLVNWLEVEPPRTGPAKDDGDWEVAQWAQKAYAAEVDEDDPSIWTGEIPPALIHFNDLEDQLETPTSEMPPQQIERIKENNRRLNSMIPQPPALPRHLEKVILNTTPKELDRTVGGAGGDDNSILPVPNHVVLNHLTASAIKNGMLAVGTTTRYKRKYISTIYFKPVYADQQ